MSFGRILAADIGGFSRAHEIASYALAVLAPVAAFSAKGSYVEKACDWGLCFAIPVHMHISTNALVTDYVPTAVRGPVRGAILAASVVTYMGITKVNLTGPGLTSTVKTLWSKPQAQAA